MSPLSRALCVFVMLQITSVCDRQPRTTCGVSVYSAITGALLTCPSACKRLNNYTQPHKVEQAPEQRDSYVFLLLSLSVSRTRVLMAWRLFADVNKLYLGLQLTITCVVHGMVKRVHRVWFTVIEEQRNQNIFSFKKLKP